MSKINYNRVRRKAHKLIRDNGAEFIVERDGRKTRGYAVQDGRTEGWDADMLVSETTATFYSTVEVTKGELVYFTGAKQRFQVIDCTPDDPTGVAPIIWTITASI